MTETPTTPAVSVDEQAAFEVMRADAVSTGRANSAAEFLAGLIVGGQLATVGRPDKLPADLFPGVDPVVVQRIWERGLAVGLFAGQRCSAPRIYRDELERIAGQLEAAGYHAMARSVTRSRALVAGEVGVHPADDQIGRGH